MSTGQSVTKQVHDQLVAVLAELFGDSVHAVESPNPENGLVKYGYTDVGLLCAVAVVPLNDRAASINVNVRLGRMFVGYRKALRWLAINRAGNTVGLSVHDGCLESRELWVYCNRVTLPKDEPGVKEMFLDVHIELERILTGFRCWFPQLLDGGDLVGFEKQCEEDGSEGLRSIITQPQGFRDWLRENPDDAVKVNPYLAVQALGWLGCWEEQLPWLDRTWEVLSEAERTPERRKNWLTLRAGALRQLKRGDEVLVVARELQQSLTDEQWVIAGTSAAAALYLLGRNDEVLEELRGAQFDGNPRAWYWRSLAEARLGNRKNSVEAYEWYERGIGPDILGRKQLLAILPAADELAA